MAVHDVSHELRGRHGEWTKGGAALHRLAGEAKASGEKAGGHKEGDRVKYKTGAIGTVHHVDEKGVPHVVWDKGRGKPVRTPAHHLTSATSPPSTEKAAREVTGAKPTTRMESTKFPHGTHISIHSGKYSGTDGTVVGASPGQGLLEVKREGDMPGHTILVKETNVREVTKKSTEQVAKDYRREKLAEIGHVPSYKPPRQAGSRGGVPAPTTGPQLRPGQYKQPTQQAYMRDVNKRKDLDAASKEKWMGKSVDIHAGIDAGKSGKVIHADKNGVIVDLGNGKRSTPGIAQIKESKSDAPGLDPKLLAQVRAIEAEEKARVARENKARFPHGSVTEYKNAGVGVGPADLRGGATPPKTPNISSKISSVEASFREEGISYTPQDLVATRLDSVQADLKSGDSRITIKVPSGSEVTIPRDVAQELVNRVKAGQASARQSNLRQMRQFGY